MPDPLFTIIKSYKINATTIVNVTMLLFGKKTTSQNSIILKFGCKMSDNILNESMTNAWQIILPSVRFFFKIRDLKHRRRGRQRQRQKTIVVINKTLALHVH